MSGNNRQNRYGGMKKSNAGPQMWKPITKNASDGSSVSSKKDDSLIPRVLATHSQAESPSLPLVKDMENLKLNQNSVQSPMNQVTDKIQLGIESDMLIKPSVVHEKGKEIEETVHCEKQEDTDRATSIKPFDICPKKDPRVKQLKPSLHKMNREIRNQRKLSAEGQNIILLRPGMLLLKRYISYEEQISIVKTCRDLGIGEGGFYKPGYRVGTKLHLRMMCLGQNWDPESSKYSEIRAIDNSKPPQIPVKFHEMVKKALQDSNDHIRKTIAKPDAGKLVPSMLPDICIVNFYTQNGKLGLHQDKDESDESLNKGLPVVSFSIGDSAEFLYGDNGEVDNAEKVVLESGDVLIFGGKSRRVFHGVSSIEKESAPSLLREATDMLPGRLNLTFRQY